MKIIKSYRVCATVFLTIVLVVLANLSYLLHYETHFYKSFDMLNMKVITFCVSLTVLMKPKKICWQLIQANLLLHMHKNLPDLTIYQNIIIITTELQKTHKKM